MAEETVKSDSSELADGGANQSEAEAKDAPNEPREIRAGELAIVPQMIFKNIRRYIFDTITPKYAEAAYGLLRDMDDNALEFTTLADMKKVPVKETKCEPPKLD